MKMKKEKNQILIDEFKKKKEIERQNQQLEQELSNQVVYSQFDIDRIRNREEALLEKRKNGIQERMRKQIDKEAEIMQSKMFQATKIRKDNKINQETQAYKNRQRAKFDPRTDKGKDACTMANNLLGRGARGIPLWRKGL